MNTAKILPKLPIEYAGIEKFHKHLDVCRQCREHPFALCLEGSRLLHETVRPQQQP